MAIKTSETQTTITLDFHFEQQIYFLPTSAFHLRHVGIASRSVSKIPILLCVPDGVCNNSQTLFFFLARDVAWTKIFVFSIFFSLLYLLSSVDYCKSLQPYQQGFPYFWLTVFYQKLLKVNYLTGIFLLKN